MTWVQADLTTKRFQGKRKTKGLLSHNQTPIRHIPCSRQGVGELGRGLRGVVFVFHRFHSSMRRMFVTCGRPVNTMAALIFVLFDFLIIMVFAMLYFIYDTCTKIPQFIQSVAEGDPRWPESQSSTYFPGPSSGGAYEEHVPKSIIKKEPGTSKEQSSKSGSKTKTKAKTKQKDQEDKDYVMENCPIRDQLLMVYGRIRTHLDRGVSGERLHDRAPPPDQSWTNDERQAVRHVFNDLYTQVTGYRSDAEIFQHASASNNRSTHFEDPGDDDNPGIIRKLSDSISAVVNNISHSLDEFRREDRQTAANEGVEDSSQQRLNNAQDGQGNANEEEEQPPPQMSNANWPRH